ncbi:MAG: hypothetical protein R6V01_00935 [Thermoplasmatota archaeon]
MTGKSKYCTPAVAVLLVLVTLAQPVEHAGGGPTRASGTDIIVSSITSHSDGGMIPLQSQSVSARIENNGTIDHADPVTARLHIYYPANESNMSLVYSNSTDLGMTLSWVGNQTTVTFPDWMPLDEGYYALNVSVDAADDHMGNNSINITLRAVLGDPVGLSIYVNPASKVMDPGESTTDPGNGPYRFQIQNDGIDPDTFTIIVTSSWVTGVWPTSTGVVQPGERSDVIEIHIQVPVDAEPGEIDILIFEATSNNDPSISNQTTVTTYLIRYSGVDVTVISEKTQVGYPGGDWVFFDFLVTNTGSSYDSYTLGVKSRPNNWAGQFNTGSDVMYIKDLEPGVSRVVTAKLRIPDLNYETMERDNTLRNSKGALILTATGLSGLSGSDEGIVIVGLVHTVDMDIRPENHTYEWSPDSSPTELRSFNFTVDITSVNNIRNSQGMDMDVNLTLPQGPHGVLYTPIWDPTGPNETQSRKWDAVVSPRTLHLESGQSFGATLLVTAPRFPFQGTALTLIEATPLIDEGAEGLELPARETAEVIVGPFLDYSVEPPRTEAFPEIMNGSVPLDGNNNGRPDWQEGAPGDIVMLPFNITNTGNTADSYLIDANAALEQPAQTLPNEWEMVYKKTTDTTLPFWYDPEGSGYWTKARIAVKVPNGAPIGEKVNITVRVTSAYSKDARYEGPSVEPILASVNIYVVQGFALDLEPEENKLTAEPDETVEYYLNITNNGNGVDTVAFLTMVPDLKGWTVEFEFNDIEMEPLEKRTFKVLVTPSEFASADDVLDIKIRARSRRNPSTFDDVWINTTVEYVGGVELEILGDRSLIWRYPGEIATFGLRIRNTGNGNDSFDISLDMGSDSWVGNIDLGSKSGTSVVVDIARGKAKEFIVNISLPSILQANEMEDLEELDIVAGTRIDNFIIVSPREYPSISETTELAIGVLQQYKADITLSPLETKTNKEVMVGESTTFRMILTNKGNGDDDLSVVHSSPTGPMKHNSWATIDLGPHQLQPFEPKQLELVIEPYAEDTPAYGERIDMTVEAMAGNNVTYRKLNVSATVVMTRMLSSTSEIDLGTTGEVVIRICNMPDPGETVISGFTLQKIYNITSLVDQDSGTGEGWRVEEPYLDITMVEAYQTTDLSIPVSAPDELISNSETATIDITVRGYGAQGKEETRSTAAMGVYFDASMDVDNVRFENLYEGRTARAYITMHATGTRGQDIIPVLVKVGGEEIGRYDAGPADPQDLASNGSQEIQFVVDFDLPSLKWYEKGKNLEMEVFIDPDDQIVENTRSGRSLAETNNGVTKELLIKNYSPHWSALILLGLLLLISALAGVIGFFYLDKRNSWYLLPLSVGLAGLFSMLFYVPVESTTDDLGAANIYGLMIIFIDLVVIVPIMVYLYTRAGDGYILHLISKRRKREITEGQEINSSLLKPLLISLIGGLLVVLVPSLFWVVPSELNEGINGVLDAFFTLESGFPIWVIVLLVPALALGLQLLLVQLKKRALKGIERTWEQLEGLRKEIKEGLQ